MAFKTGLPWHCRSHPLDLASCAAAHNIPQNPLRATHITLPHLHAVTRPQNLDLRIGLEPTERMGTFLRDSYFAAVVGDALALEV